MVVRQVLPDSADYPFNRSQATALRRALAGCACRTRCNHCHIADRQLSEFESRFGAIHSKNLHSRHQSVPGIRRCLPNLGQRPIVASSSTPLPTVQCGWSASGDMLTNRCHFAAETNN